MNTDAIAIQRWMTERDPEAFRVLVVRYSAMVYSTCRRVMRNAADAEDAAQESFQVLAMLQQAPKGDLGPWLHRVAVNKSLNRLRADARREERNRVYGKRLAPAEPAWNDLYEYVDEAIGKLPDKYRLPVVRHFLQGETQEAIAQTMSLTRQTVAYRIQCGLDRIRKSLRRQGVVASGVALSAMLAAHAAEAAPASLNESLGKLAILSHGVPVQPLPFLARVRVGLLSAKGAVTMLVIAAIAIATSYSLSWERFPVNTPKRKQAPSSHSQKQAARPAAIPAPVVKPDFDPETANEAPVPFAAPAEVPNMGEIRGCLRSESGEALAGVEVRLSRTRSCRKGWGSIGDETLNWTATTDAQGMFTFSELPVCNGSVLRGRQYFRISAESGGKCAEKTFDRPFWEMSSFHDLALSPVAYIEIGAFNEQGAPVTNGTIHMEDASRLFRRLTTPEEVTLGPDGSVKAGPFFPGTYSLKIHAPGYADAGLLVSHDVGQARFVLTPAATITGKTLDAATRTPLAGAVIEAITLDRKKLVDHTLSGPDGAFAIAAQSEASLLLYARLEDKCLPVGWQQVRGDARAGAGITLELAQGGVVSGRAFDPVSGEGVPNIPVCFAFEGDFWDNGFINAYTDVTGAYTLKGVTGKGAVKALDWWDPACAHTMDATPGQRIENVDFMLPKNCRVAGRVVGERNAPMPGVLVAATPIRNMDNRKPFYAMRFMTSSSDEAGSLSDAEGRFVCFMRGNTGDIYLQALGNGCVSQKIGPIELPENGLSGLVVRMETTGSITGHIVDVQSRPVPGADVVVQPLDPARGSMLLGRDWATHGQMDAYYPACGFRPTVMGDFAFSPLLPGKYRVMAFLDASSANAPLAVEDVTVAPGAVQDVLLTVRMDGLSSVRGTITAHGRPQPNLKLEAVGGGYIENLIAVTSSEGVYEFTHLAGDSLRFVVRHPDKNDSLAEKTVGLIPGKTVTLDIDVPVGTARIEGAVRVDGVPAERQSVCLMPFDGAPGQSFTVLTDVKGRFEIPDVLAGVYVLGILENGGQNSTATQSLIAVAEGQTVQHDFDIGGGVIAVSVEGVAEDERGHIAILPGEINLPELTEEALLALAPQAVKYSRANADIATYMFSGLASGVYTVFGAAHPRASDEASDALKHMRVLYAVVDVAGGEPVPVTFDFARPGLPATESPSNGKEDHGLESPSAPGAAVSLPPQVPDHETPALCNGASATPR